MELKELLLFHRCKGFLLLYLLSKLHIKSYNEYVNFIKNNKTSYIKLPPAVSHTSYKSYKNKIYKRLLDIKTEHHIEIMKNCNTQIFSNNNINTKNRFHNFTIPDN